MNTNDSLNTLDASSPCAATRSFGMLFGRVALSTIFVLSALGKFAAWHTMADLVASKGLPWPNFWLAGAVTLELLGGLSVLIGLKARWGALALAAFLIPVTLIMHDFWALNGQALQMMMIEFLKNLAILGGVFYIAVFGAGAYSLDAWRAHHAQHGHDTGHAAA